MRFAAFAAALMLATATAAQDAPEGDIVTATQIGRFQGVALGGTVGRLIWRGGIVLTSQADRFGGISGLAFTGPDSRFATVSDTGNFITGQLIYDEAGSPFGLVGIAIDAIQNSKGVDLPRQFARDAEAVAVIVRDGALAAVRVGFENLTRVADFELVDSVPTGAAKEVLIPDWLTDERTNESLEAVCIAPPASPIAGSTLLLTEDVAAQDGEHSAWLLGVNDRGPLTLAVSPGVNPTDCAFLPNGDLLVLERGVSLLSFTMILKRIAASDVRPGARMDGEVLLRASGGDIDNMEALAVHEGPSGETRITLMSDSNFNDWQRNLLLEFALTD
jgi:hypothetical protein